MKVLLSGKMIASPAVILIIFLVAVIGYFLVNTVANRKWGFTKKRENELENQSDLFPKNKKKE